MTFLELAAVAMLLIGMALSALRLFIGPTTPDRVVAADTLAVITTAGLAGLASLFDNPVYLDVALVYGTLAFVGTVAIARAIEGDRE
ncbi:MAG TPA: cation:proton antiporter [Gammaproteobacteria bacterium]|nr:cation:proton antiporter [Gammaproteobacteria bacterium]